MVDKLIIVHIFKKSINNTKEIGDQKKNPGYNVILAAYLSLPDCNASLLTPFILFPFQKTLIFSLFSKHNFSKKFISIHLKVFSEVPKTQNLIIDFITNILSLFHVLMFIYSRMVCKTRKHQNRLYFNF